MAMASDNFLQANHLKQTNRRQARDARYIYNACDSWRQLLPPTNSRQATAVRAAAKRDSTGRRPWLTPFRDCACSPPLVAEPYWAFKPTANAIGCRNIARPALVAGGIASSRYMILPRQIIANSSLLIPTNSLRKPSELRRRAGSSGTSSVALLLSSRRQSRSRSSSFDILRSSIMVALSALRRRQFLPPLTETALRT